MTRRFSRQKWLELEIWTHHFVVDLVKVNLTDPLDHVFVGKSHKAKSPEERSCLSLSPN